MEERGVGIGLTLGGFRKLPFTKTFQILENDTWLYDIGSGNRMQNRKEVPREVRKACKYEGNEQTWWLWLPAPAWKTYYDCLEPLDDKAPMLCSSATSRGTIAVF